MFDIELLVIEDYMPSTRLEEYDFRTIQIWVRIFDLSLGLMNRMTCESIGKRMGNWERMSRWRREMMACQWINIGILG